MGHGHSHAHSHGHGATQQRLLAAAVVHVLYVGVEIAYASWSGVLFLWADAAHMLSDAAAIALALFATRLAARPPSGGFTFGLKRAEILSAQANGLTLLVLGVLIVIEAVDRKSVV